MPKLKAGVVDQQRPLRNLADSLGSGSYLRLVTMGHWSRGYWENNCDVCGSELKVLNTKRDYSWDSDCHPTRKIWFDFPIEWKGGSIIKTETGVVEFLICDTCRINGKHTRLIMDGLNEVIRTVKSEIGSELASIGRSKKKLGELKGILKNNMALRQKLI